MANPNNAWKYRGARVSVETRPVDWSNEDEVRAEMKAKYPAPEFEVRKVNRVSPSRRRYSEMVAYRN